VQGRKRAASMKIPAKITATSLNNIALHYLERFASSAANLRRVLMRRVKRSAAHHGSDPTEDAALVEALIQRFERSGLLDDQRYAAAKAASLRRRGGSRRAISCRLAQHGVAAELVAETLQALEAEPGGGDLAAACAFIRRRRLGAHRTATRVGGPEKEMTAKDMASLARAGFSFEIARRVLACADVEAVEALLNASGDV
jgi:regulatory protein